MLRVTEIYRSIQGEGTRAGLACTFVRLTGCNLRCVWCDTAYAFHGGEDRSLSSVTDEVAGLGAELVLITGGEPLMQPECLDLLGSLCDAGHEVLLETGGSLDIGPVDPRVRRIVDIKCPASGESHRNRWDNLPLLGAGDEVKLVVAQRSDFEWGLEAILRVPPAAEVLWSPVHGVCDPADLAAWMLEAGARGRLQLQLHKVIWPDADRGV